MNCCISFNFECVPGQSVLLLNGGLGKRENVGGHPTPTLRLNLCSLIGQSVIFAEMGW